ncbi:MAG: HAMP domain-containing histidine kinase [Deltaproteobacteria bacterium]|nr:HAMP domain-containing histidine kinase [Deltaproteobacteria bacterium]
MKALLQNVEDAVRPHPEQRFVEVDLNTMVSRVVGLMAYEMKKRNVKFVASYDPAEPRILGVPSQIEQIIVNLVANAADACPERNGAVSVETQIRNAGVNLVVTDNGAGLSEDEIAKIFDPFFTTKNRSDQLGLGLYVVASIVDRHKGHISVESNPGRRTAFTVTFPMAV